MTSTAWLPRGKGFPKEIAIRQQAAWLYVINYTLFFIQVICPYELRAELTSSAAFTISTPFAISTVSAIYRLLLTAHRLPRAMHLALCDRYENSCY
jgi:hypothetical protein